MKANVEDTKERLRGQVFDRWYRKNKVVLVKTYMDPFLELLLRRRDSESLTMSALALISCLDGLSRKGVPKARRGLEALAFVCNELVTKRRAN